MFFCNHCNLTIEDLDLYRDHLKEEQHRNNSDVDLSSKFYCSTCEIKCSGSVPFEEHLISKNHKKKEKKLESVNQCNQLIKDEISAIESSSRDASLSNNNAGYEFKSEDKNNDINTLNDPVDFLYSCATCDKKFNGILPYNQHLSSEKHEKKERESERIKQIQMNKSATEDIVSENEILNEFSKFSVIDDTFESLSCTICKVSFPGIESYESHMIGRKHKRKIKELKVFEQLQQTENIEYNLNISIKSNEDIARNILEACNEDERDFNSEQNSDTNNLNSNLKYDKMVCDEQFIANEKYKEKELENIGEKFCKNETNMLTESVINNEKTLIDINKSNSKLTNSLKNMPDNLQNDLYHCDVCDINLSGIIPYDQHLKGNKHKKEKMKAEYVKLQSLNTVVNNDENISFEYQEKKFQISNLKYDKIVCDEQCIANEKYKEKEMENIGEKFCKNETNMLTESVINNEKTQIDINKSNSKLTNSLENMPDNLQNDLYHCDVCGINLSGIIPYDQHLKGNKHKKEKMKAEYVKLQSLNTVVNNDENISLEYQKKEFEISNTSLKTNQSNISLSSVNSTASYIPIIDSCNNNFLFCKICNVPCSGIIPYKQHIDSEKHLKKQLFYESFNESKDVKLPDLSITSNSNIPERKSLKMNVFKSEYSDNDKTQLEKSEDLALNNIKCLICNEIFSEIKLFEEHKNNCKCLSEKKLNMADKIAVIKNGNNQLSENNCEESPKVSSSKVNFNNYLYNGLGACSKTVEGQSSHEIQSATSLQILTCDICSTPFTGHIPFEQHLKSLKHKKKVEKLKIIKSRENVSKSEKFSSQNIIEQNANEEYDTTSVNYVNKFEYEFPHLDIKPSNANNESDVMLESDQFSMLSSTSSIEILSDLV